MASKVVISIPDDLLKRIDSLVRRHAFPSRTAAIAEAIREKLDRVDKTRLTRECAKLGPKQEKALADEGFARDLEKWGEY